MKYIYLPTAIISMLISSILMAQTNPSPHDLSGGDFVFNGFDDGESTTYPASSQGWRFGSEPTAAQVGPATGDRDLESSSASATSGNIKKKMAFLFSTLAATTLVPWQCRLTIQAAKT